MRIRSASSFVRPTCTIFHPVLLQNANSLRRFLHTHARTKHLQVGWMETTQRELVRGACVRDHQHAGKHVVEPGVCSRRGVHAVPSWQKQRPEIVVNREFIVYMVECDVDVVEKYESLFSPIEKPSKKLIL